MVDALKRTSAESYASVMVMVMLDKTMSPLTREQLLQLVANMLRNCW